MTDALSTVSTFARSPIKLDGFTLRARAVTVNGRPSIKAWLAAVKFAQDCAEASPYWWGDLLRYATTREDYAEAMTQALEATGWTKDTAHNVTSMCNRVNERTRELSPSPGHSEAVAALDEAAQVKWLKRTRDGQWTVKDLRQAIKRSTKRHTLDGQAPTMHVVEVSVEVTVEADSEYEAEQSATMTVKRLLKGYNGLKVGGARVRPHVKGDK
jgi:hypothetical protein